MSVPDPKNDSADSPVTSVETLKRYFDHVFANSRDIMNLFSLTQGKVVMLNAEAERATGYDLEGLQTTPVHAMYPADEHPKLHSAFERLRDTGYSSDKLCMYSKSGELRDIWTRSYVVQREPETICIVHTIDMTEENRRRERELRDAKLATLGEASATLAHELKNALQSMQFSLSTLRSQLSAGGLERASSSLSRLERAAAHMDDVIGGIEKSTQGSLGAAHISVPAAVQNAVQLMRGYLTAKGIEFSIEFHNVIPLVRCDQAELEQILVVLLKNAAQAMASRETRLLRIDVDHTDEGVHVDVTDTGGGISPAIEARLFEAFATSKPSGLGHGLGLATAKRLAAENRIQVRFASHLGVGTTFSLCFAPEAEPERRRETALSSAGVVLLVSDDPNLVASTTEALREAGARVLLARSAAEGLQLLRVHAVAAVLCDQALYPVDGLRFVQDARTFYRGPVCLIVAEREKHSLDSLAGVDSVLTKPVKTRVLTVTLNALLA